MTIEPITHRNGISAIYDRREALNRMDTGERQVPDKYLAGTSGGGTRG